jgi:hypothetical protein
MKIDRFNNETRIRDKSGTERVYKFADLQYRDGGTVVDPDLGDIVIPRYIGRYARP